MWFRIQGWVSIRHSNFEIKFGLGFDFEFKIEGWDSGLCLNLDLDLY